MDSLTHIRADTSKFSSHKEVYGRRGLFLASLASLSLLTITSRHVRHQSTNTVIFHHSTPIARLIPAPAQQRLRFCGYGTRVTVNDLFGNMPVRVKSRALALQKPDELERAWEDLKQLLAAVMLANDHLTKLIVSDSRRRVTIRPQAQGQRTEDELDVYRVSSIIAQASLANVQGSDWNVVSASVPDFSIHAAICLQPNPTKKVQFISLGKVPVFPRNSTNVLYSEINRLFATSDFGTLGSGGGSFEKDHTSTKMAPKAVNKWPMFYIRIDTNIFREWDDDEIAPESDKSIQHILDVLTAMVNEFLTQHDLRPRAGKRKRKGPSQAGQESSREPGGYGQAGGSRGLEDHASQSGSTEETLGQLKLPSFRKPVSQSFGDWSRVKSAKDLLPGKLPLRNHAGPPEGNEQSPAIGDSTSKRMPWTDPYTGQTHMVNSRTGQSGGLTHDRAWSSGMQTKRVSNRGRPTSILSTDSWVGNVLKDWENPAFSRPEQPINSIDGRHGLETLHKCADLCGLDTVKISKFRGKLWKQHLEEAEVIAQVDRKFILAKLAASPGDDTGVLVLIDQHAADERCRVEGLFEELFTGDRGQVQTIAVDPIVFQVPVTEKSLLQRHRRFFQSWGIGYGVEQASTDVCVSVHSLPALVAERCRTEPTLASDLIRREIWKREEHGNPPDQKTQIRHRSPGATVTWAERLSTCPQGLIDMMNSRACRTAIMFNDELDILECQTLVAQLARCLFPFQCAHGRPSLVPVLDMQASPSPSLRPSSADTDRPGFLEAFRASGLY